MNSKYYLLKDSDFKLATDSINALVYAGISLNSELKLLEVMINSVEKDKEEIIDKIKECNSQLNVFETMDIHDVDSLLIDAGFYHKRLLSLSFEIQYYSLEKELCLSRLNLKL